VGIGRRKTPASRELEFFVELVPGGELTPQLFDITGAGPTVYPCGHPSMIRNGKGVLQRAGSGTDSVKEER
jgi:hypothetical protein